MQHTFTDWALVSLSVLPIWVKVLVSVAVLVACCVVLWSYRHVRWRWLLMGLRLVAAVLVLGFLLEPALQLRVVRRVRNRVAVVVDNSRSMALAAPGARSRYDGFLAVLRADGAVPNELARSHTVEWHDLDGPVSVSALLGEPTAETTDLLRALEIASASGAGKPLAGIVLVSDGADNVDLESRDGKGLSKRAEERLGALSVPVNTIDAADGGTFKDVAVAEVLSDEFAFVHNSFDVEAVIEAPGIAEMTLPVTLRQGGQTLATQEVTVGQGSRTRVVFKTKPSQIGEYVYTVAVPAIPAEAIESNNQRSFVLRVIRDKIRVLQVAGRPSWDERFLRQHLKEDPNADLISFFILRTPSDVPHAPDEELSLIPFPVEKLFGQELRTFDVAVFQNFDYRPYQMGHFLQNIRDAVVDGLGFVMLGGPQSFADGGYLGTPLDEVIPLRLEVGGMVEGKVVPVLSDTGRRHPITDLTRGKGRSERLWHTLPAWTGMNRTAGAMPNAAVLVHASRRVEGNGAPAPLIAVKELGKGRSMAIATDSMWRWRFSSKRDGGASERAYHRFWANALRWLVRDPEHSRVQVRATKRRFDVSEPVEVTLAVRGQDYQPLPYAQLRVLLMQADGAAHSSRDIQTGETGVARTQYKDLEPGAYRVVAQARSGGVRLGEGSCVFVLEARSAELRRGEPRPDLLQAMAEQTGGRHVSLETGLWSELDLTDPREIEVDRRRNIELWDNAWALTLGVLLLALEWTVRRRRGYL